MVPLFLCRTQGDHRSWKFPHFATWAPSYQVRSMQDQKSFLKLFFIGRQVLPPSWVVLLHRRSVPGSPAGVWIWAGETQADPYTHLPLLWVLTAHVSEGVTWVHQPPGEGPGVNAKVWRKRLSTTTCLWTAARGIESPTPGKINDNVSHQKHIYSTWRTTSWWDTAEHLPWNHKFMFEHGNRIAIVYENNTMKINCKSLYSYNIKILSY